MTGPARASPRSTCRTSGCRSAMPDDPRRPLYAEPPGAPPRAGRRARLRPPRRLRRPRAQRQPGLPDRLRPALRGGAPRRRAGRRAGDPRRQRVLGHGRRRAPADAAPAVPGPEPARPAARPVAAARRDPRDEGIGPGAGSASSAGRPTPAGRPSRPPPSWSTSSGRRPRTAWWRTPPTS